MAYAHCLRESRMHLSFFVQVWLYRIASSSHYPPPREQSAGLSNLSSSNLVNSYTAHDMSSHPPNKWLTLTPEHRTTSAPQQETHHTNIPSSHPPNKWLTLTPEPQTTSAPQQETQHTDMPLTRPQATTANPSTLEALKPNSEAGEVDDAPDAKKAALHRDTQVMTEQMSKLKALAKRIRRLRGLEESDDEEVTWVFQQLLESAKGRPERMWWMDKLAIIAQDG